MFSINARLSRAATLGFTVALLLCGNASVSAQASFPPTTAKFRDVLRLAQETYPDSARKTIQKMIDAMSPTDPLYPEALYTSASITRPLEETRLLFARVAADYETSPWADKALYRLALIDFGLSNIDASVTSMRRIFSNYPKSPVIPSAALYGARAAFQKNDLQLGCDWLKKGLAVVGNDTELKNQLEYTRGRCVVGTGVEMAPPMNDSLRLAPAKPPATTGTGTATTATSTAASTTPPVGSTTTPPKTATPKTAVPKTDTAPKTKSASTPTTGKWRVQVAAITNTAAIQRAVAGIKKLGFTAYQVKGDGKLIKIQAGPFATKEAAAAQVSKLAKAVGGKPFVVQVP